MKKYIQKKINWLSYTKTINTHIKRQMQKKILKKRYKNMYKKENKEIK